METVKPVVCDACNDVTYFFNDDNSVTECVCRANKAMAVKLPGLFTPPEEWVETPVFVISWRKKLPLVYQAKEGYENFKRRACPALAQVIYKGKRCRVFDGTKLSSVYFNRDPEFDSMSELLIYISDTIDLVIFSIGFSDPNINNKHITGDIIAAVIHHCNAHGILYWIVMSNTMQDIQKNFGAQLFPILDAVKYKVL